MSSIEWISLGRDTNSALCEDRKDLVVTSSSIIWVVLF